MDMADIAKAAGGYMAMLASGIATAVGIRTLWEKRNAAMKEFRESLATKEQVERHKEANEEQIQLLREELSRRLDAQDSNIENLNTAVRDMPLRIVEAMGK